MALLVQVAEIVRGNNDNNRRPRVFRDRLNPLDYLRDSEIVERYRLPRVFIFELIDLVREDVERPTLRSHAIPASLQVKTYM
jgi:hypothetical protein